MKNYECRVCSIEIKELMSFGKMPIANAFVINKNDDQYLFNLKIGFCEKCFTFQVLEIPEAKKMFNDNYAYLASTSQVMKNHWKELGDKLIKEKKLEKSSFVVEVGSNDGIFLENISKKEIPHLGIDASKNVCDIAEKKGVKTLNGFFGVSIADEIVSKHGKADVILSTNTMHHIEDINNVAEGMSKLIKDDGIIITEDPSLVEMIKKNSYDQIYAEHMYIWSLASMNSLFNKFNLEVFDIKNNNFHGGCSRYFIGKKNKRKISQSVIVHEKLETKVGINKISTYRKFIENVELSKKKLNQLINKIKDEGKKIVGYGAPAKSTTVLNYCGLNYESIDAIYDNSATKINKYTPGKSLIKINNSSNFEKEFSEYCVLFAWNHKDEILNKEKQYSKKGGKWIIPVDGIEII
ncbi:class I SAM-dependent methyltransferase [Pelagibacteraceae bacterium]|nr:class I SAM-dependent methyltransferase [Pelagibacteraceae bacterium]